MAIVIGDRFPYNASLMEVLNGSVFQIWMPPVELARATEGLYAGDPLGFIKSLPDCEGVTIGVNGVPDGTCMKELKLGDCDGKDYSVLFCVDPAPKVDSIYITCDLVEGNPTGLRTMQLSSAQFDELIAACRDYVATHAVNPIEKPVAQSKGPAKKAKPVAKGQQD